MASGMFRETSGLWSLGCFVKLQDNSLWFASNEINSGQSEVFSSHEKNLTEKKDSFLRVINPPLPFVLFLDYIIINTAESLWQHVKHCLLNTISGMPA
jgi:hypothetical protein